MFWANSTADTELQQYQMAEYRISVYGRNVDEWDKLAKWMCV